ncbi:putative mitochondrial choline/ethanolamine phosphotransferase (CEPT) [Leptomonas pyrrhocoris]|uniref:Putative mitochondrial choline/ethanolamine phosphotransferase (CEPT) n=1 Tax=Leptomonas pyrrhocoris TaxID=157538 RepID=A0A0M9G3X2_LEPPY|nr:putative mitochondrial choline/ethanolamine phosphotransferase (CEPT) [Leptomonas pyrrhocoris]KPA81733.1 putative mitochondrial choline/ethanolamine phosphotransferase (CEPT) [Leptomonas pyrrhocoris]|eukprot:XP_015660172.1 putative mitochondrial choline/ethanolamine phosphotransferase (CEPT) [Leptomonas pyrrhocoris]
MASAPVASKHSLKPAENEYIAPSYLPNLKKYKYSGADFSIVSRYILQPYWNFIVSLVPMTVAPNQITFTGFLVGMSSTLVLLYYYFFENGDFPSWALYYAAFSLFAYQTLDAIDGKQARRTGAGSPLGELFDHGCDAFLTPFVMVNVTLAMYVDGPARFWPLALTCLGLFTAIWEQFSTGTFDLGYVSGPTEGILVNCLIFTLSAIWKESLWSMSVVGPYDIPYPAALSFLFPNSDGTVHFETAREVIFVVFVLSCSSTVLVNIAHVVVRPSVHSSKLVPFLAALPIAFVSGLVLHIFVLYPAVPARFPFALEVSYGLLLSITVTRLTIARLCVMPYKSVHLYYVLYTGTLMMASAAHYLGDAVVARATVETTLGWALVGLVGCAALQYTHMILSVFGQIARYLNISIMTIGPKKNA